MRTRNESINHSFRRRIAYAVAALTVLVAASQCSPLSAQEGKEHPLAPAIKYAEQSHARAIGLGTYEASFQKRELVANSVINQHVRMKVRQQPFSVYMYFEAPHEGREVIYVDGRNNNNLLAHETGIASLIGTLELSPTGGQAMSENRYPITKAGIANLAKAVIEQWKKEQQYGETEVKYYKDAKVGKYSCKVIESTHPRPRRQFNFHMTRLWIDDESGLPVRVQQFGFPTSKNAKPPVIEDYIFSSIKSEVRLTDRDFDVNNPKYNF
jgi:Protein of unknown function (DUF1571)